MRVELPLEPLEAFRLASFNIEYVPRYAPIKMDRDCVDHRLYRVRSDCVRPSLTHFPHQPILITEAELREAVNGGDITEERADEIRRRQARYSRP